MYDHMLEKAPTIKRRPRHIKGSFSFKRQTLWLAWQIFTVYITAVKWPFLLLQKQILKEMDKAEDGYECMTSHIVMLIIFNVYVHMHIIYIYMVETNWSCVDEVQMGKLFIGLGNGFMPI